VKTNSEPINLAISKAMEFDNPVMEVQLGWSKMDKVIVMQHSLCEPLREQISDIGGLDYSHYDRDPHNKGGDYFRDRESKVALAFPL